MSLLKAIKAQLGLSNTPANNFTITAEADNGTLKMARGNAGATTQDILTVDASGNVLVGGNNLNLFSAKSLVSNGYQKLPSGLIIQWGTSGNVAADTLITVTFPIAFPNAALSMSATDYSSVSSKSVCWSGDTPTLSGCQLHWSPGASGVGGSSTRPARWIAIGY